MSTLLAAQRAARALAGHRPGQGMLFSSPRGAVVGSGRLHDLLSPHDLPSPASGPDVSTAAHRLPAQVSAALADARAAGHPDPVAIGALPFQHGPFQHGALDNGPGRLVLPEYVTRSPARAPAAEPQGPQAPPVPVWPRPPTVTDEPSPEAYRRAVDAAIEHLRSGALEKVVLARSLRVTGDEPADSTALLTNLAAANPRGHTFSIGLGGAAHGSARNDAAHGGATLVGASPELLVARNGNVVTAQPMAGSAPRSGDREVDRDRARALLTSGKDLHEHAVVVDAVHKALRPLCADLTVPEAPSITMTPTMIHLATEIEGTLADPATTSLDLALALHPTPAVCGAPTDAARGLIGRLEPFDRGLYAGLVGWMDSGGDGEWVVTIRCGIVDGTSVQLFAGAGIMAGSDPDAELAETTAKFGTLLRALGV